MKGFINIFLMETIRLILNYMIIIKIINRNINDIKIKICDYIELEIINIQGAKQPGQCVLSPAISLLSLA